MKQETFTDMERIWNGYGTDMEYSCRMKKTKREELGEIMEEIILWGNE